MDIQDNKQTKALRDQLVDELVSTKCIRSLDVERAFRKVPRHFFLRDTEVAEVYTNKAIVTKFEDKRPVSSSSQPSLMADMLEALDIRKGMRVLEIGAGTGYNAALMAELTHAPGNVYSVDIQEDIVEQCQANLSEAGYPDIHVIHGDGGYGYAPAAPYDRIIVACQAWDIPPAWVEQLEKGGVILIPLSIEKGRRTMMIPRFVKSESCLISESAVTGGFMWMEGDFSLPEGLGTVVVIDPVDYTGHRPIQEASFWIVSRDASPDIGASIRCLFHSWEGEGSVDFGSWLEEHGFLLMLTLEGVNNLEASSKTSEHGFEGTGKGVLDIDAGSAALVAGGKGDIIVYGSDAAMETLSGVISRWEAMGRPGLLDFQVMVYPLDYSVTLQLDEWLVQKPSAQIVLSPVDR